MQIFAGSASQDLGDKIAKALGRELGRVSLSRFANGESRVRILEEKVESEVALVQSLASPTNDNLVEFCLLADALIRKGAKEIIAIVPWMGYSKQDKVFLSGEALGAKVVAKILQTTKITRLLTVDLHNRATLGFFDIPVTELSAKKLFLDYFRTKLSDKTVVVAPDAGAVKSSSSFASELGVPIVYLDKKRDLETGEVTISGMSRSIAQERVILVDDNVFTGATLLETAKELKKAGAEEIYVAVTHHMYIPGVQKRLEESEIDEIVVTDSVDPTSSQKALGTGKLKVLSLAGLIADSLT